MPASSCARARTPTPCAPAAEFAIAAYLNVPVYAAFHEWLGRGDVLQPMWDAWKAGDRKAALAAIPDEVVDELVVHGSPEQCREHIQRYFDNGVTTRAWPIMPLDPELDHWDAIRQLSPTLGDGRASSYRRGDLPGSEPARCRSLVRRRPCARGRSSSVISTKSKVVVALPGWRLAAVVLAGAIAAGTNWSTARPSPGVACCACTWPRTRTSSGSSRRPVRACHRRRSASAPRSARRRSTRPPRS